MSGAALLFLSFLSAPVLAAGAWWWFSRRREPLVEEEDPLEEAHRLIREAKAQPPIPRTMPPIQPGSDLFKRVEAEAKAEKARANRAESLLRGVEARAITVLSRVFSGVIVLPVERVAMPRREEAEARFVQALASSIAKDLDAGELVGQVVEEFIR